MADIDVDILRQLHHDHRDPDPAHIAKLPKPTKRDNAKGNCRECGGYHGLPAVHLDYMGHAEVTDVLLQADPTWTWEPYAVDDRGLPLVTEMGADRVLWIRLTIGGVTRPGVGTAPASKGGDTLKELIGDAIRNAAMRFGIALTLWSKAEGVTREAEDNPEPPADPADAETVTDIKQRLNALGTPARKAYLEAFGHPDQLTAARLDDALALVITLENEMAGGDEFEPGDSDRGAGPIDKPEPKEMRRLMALLKENGIAEEDRHAWASDQLGGPVASFTQLTADDAHRLIGALA